MTAATLDRRAAPVAYGISLALHAALFAALLLARPLAPPRSTPVDVEIVETAPPPRPAPAPEAVKEPEPPPPPPRPVRRPPPPRVAVPLPKDAPPPPPNQPDAPPPPNAPPPAAELQKPGPVRIGISMSSTSTAGDTAAPVGNTLYGKAPERAEDPSTAQPYRSDRYVPPTQVTTLPENLGCPIPKDAYPQEARRAGAEGDVKVRLTIDAEGRVTDARALADPGHGLGPAAERNARRYCRFRPARQNGAAVGTEIVYTIHFELD